MIDAFLLRSSIEDFRRNKVRTFLTSLGILIGVLSVVLLMALGIGLKEYIKNQFESLGTNVIYVFPGQVIRNGRFQGSEGNGTSIQFDEKDIASLKKSSNSEYVVPVFTKPIAVESTSKSETSDLYATNEEIFALRNLEVESGGIFTKTDLEKRAKVAVLGPEIATKLFNNTQSAIGKTVRLDSQRFKVIGVLKEKGGGGFGGPDFDSYVYIPYKSAYSFNPNKIFFAIYLKAFDENQVLEVKESAKKALLSRYKENDFSIAEQTEILNIVSSIFSIMNSILIAIGSISLIVGGVGIMNIMYATVTERTKEIGIRRALGATRKDILYLFIMESMLLSLFGGILGLTIAFVIVTLVKPFFPASISPVAVSLAIGISSGIGIFFGSFPANRASKLSPIDAIRYE